MDQPIPDWITCDFFAQCLRKEKGNEELIVTDFTLSAAAPPGNNYGSFIVRAKVEYKNGATDTETHSISLIIKAELTSGPLKELSNEMQQNEPSFYYNFIPAVKSFTDASFAAKCFFSPKPNVTILEDLKEQGFMMADRVQQLDFDHCRLYMMAAAEFHAVSVAVYRDHPELLEPIKDFNMFSDDSPVKHSFQGMIKYGMKCFADATEKEERFKKYSGLIRDLIPHMWDSVVEANKASGSLKTIRQGDPWTPNMMFRYDKEGNVCEIKIIDFQGTSYGSPVNDLNFFIWSSANIDVKKYRLKELYRIYVDCLNENLKQFNCTERLTLRKLEEDIKTLTPMTLISVSNLPCFVNPEPMDFGAVFSKEDDEVENFFKKMYSDNYCKNYLPHLLESLVLNGVFDLLESKRT